MRTIDFLEFIELMDKVQNKLGIKQVPHFTTLQKFMSRISSLYLNTIDSSGFTGGHCSYYYSMRTGKKRRSYLKTSIAIDVEKFLVIGYFVIQSTMSWIKGMTLNKFIFSYERA